MGSDEEEPADGHEPVDGRESIVPEGTAIEPFDTAGFRTIVEASDDGIVTFTSDQQITYVDPIVEQTIEADAETVVGVTVGALEEKGVLTETAARAIADAIERVTENREAASGTGTSIEIENGDRTIELQFTALPTDARAGDVVATIRDVTERSQTQAELLDSRRKIEQLHDAATEIIACQTEQEVADRAVQAAEEILEFDVCSLTVKRGEWFVPIAVSSGAPEDGVDRYHEEEGLLGKTHQTGESQRVDDVHADTTSKPTDDAYRSGISVPIGDRGVFQATSTEIAAFDDDDIELAETLMSHVAETLRRIDTETELREREQELVRQRDQFAALFENVPDPVVAFSFEDGQPIVTAVNSPFESVFGYSADEITGESIDEYIVPEEYSNESNHLNEMLRGGEQLQTTTQRLTADGIRDFLLHVVPIDGEQSHAQGYAIYTDITDQKEHERELERQNEQLDEFTSIVSHDLQNPLSVAEGYLELARQTGDEEHFDEVAIAHDRMRQLIDELLSLAREGKVVGETSTVALAEAANQAWSSIEAPEATLTIETEQTVEGDRERLVELLENLFRNAVDHAGPATTITVEETDGGFAVTDDGPGFDEPPEQLFETGYTTAEDGTGFGLPIVERIAAAHDWHVTATNVGDGARFEIRL